MVHGSDCRPEEEKEFTLIRCRIGEAIWCELNEASVICQFQINLWEWAHPCARNLALRPLNLSRTDLPPLARRDTRAPKGCQR